MAFENLKEFLTNDHNDTLSSIAKSTNIELMKIQNRLKSYKLYLNVGKTKYTIISQGNVPGIEPSIGDSFLWKRWKFSFPCLTLNWRLGWLHDIETARKVARGIGILKRLKPYLPLTAQKSLYYSLIQSHFQYQINNWGHNCKVLEKLQKRAIRLFTSEHYLPHFEPLVD